MCGIAGILLKRGSPLDPEVLLRMTRSLEHRGPDEEGYVVDPVPLGGRWPAQAPLRRGPAPQGTAPSTSGPAVGLGHRRLSIIDLASGQQPLCNEDGTIWITFNGEIYNFAALRAELEAKGHALRTASDTEMIVHAYEEWGAECLQRFRGMFAFAIWDARTRRLFLARDRLGKKPLFYADEPDRFLFGSEMKAILAAPGVDRAVDPTALSDYLSFLYVPAPKSILRAVRKLPAGHYALVGGGDVEVKRYWDLSFRPRPAISMARAEEEILALLDEATRIRLMSEVPLGAFLSGGVDSSAVVAFMARHSERPVVTSSVAFREEAFDESAFAQRIATRFGTDHNVYRVTPKEAEIVERLAWHYDEPFADSSAIPTYYVSQTARQRVTVALSGDGGDENFAGYRRYQSFRREHRIRTLVPAPLRPLLWGLVRACYRALPRFRRGRDFFGNVSLSPAESYARSMMAFGDGEKERALAPDLRGTLAGYSSADAFLKLYREAPADDWLSRLLYVDVKTYLCDDILTKVDRASMAVSLEVRCPLLDHVLMEYVAGLPASWKLRGATGKHLFKKALETVLPKETLYRSKMGFGVPVGAWLREALRDSARDAIVEGEATRRWLDAPYIAGLWERHQSGERDDSTRLWALFMLNLWHRQFGA
ncbi:MAG: asparagine synthase (glutamine-hydrolyzing) [Planctomycetaceae bacterium]